MAIYHLSIKIISRGTGKSAVSAAAYRAGEYLINQYDSKIHDYTRKKGVAHTEILLPENAPEEYSSRSVLWNAVESIEKSSNSQLAREVEFALPAELTQEQNIALAREYVKKTFVDKGMCADICIHDSGDSKPHAHVLLTMRPIKEDGSWGGKQKKDYILDKLGNKIYDKKKRQYKCRSIPSTDWNEQTKAEEWREAWALFANEALKKIKAKVTIDHRSYKRQGLKIKPSIKLGVVAHQMEKRGIRTERGNINREIELTNQKMRELKARIAKLEKWIDEETAKENTPTLSDVLENILTKQGQSKIVRLQNASEMFNFLQENNIETIEDLEQKVAEMQYKSDTVHEDLKKTDRRTKSLNENILHSEYYKAGRKYKRQYDRLNSEYKTANRSKGIFAKRKAQKALDKVNAYYEANRTELILYEAAEKYLKGVLQKRFDPNKLPPITKWKKELSEKNIARTKLSGEYNTLRDETKKIERIQRSVKEILRSEEKQELKLKRRELDTEL
ncbi:MAG: MobA/MobL family protein [Oscillospiraceae bacterium]|nr:MobA/MobL family protein [Oscillospiraceae bacterium]